MEQIYDCRLGCPLPLVRWGPKSVSPPHLQAETGVDSLGLTDLLSQIQQFAETQGAPPQVVGSFLRWSLREDRLPSRAFEAWPILFPGPCYQ